jgi:nucleoside-diphosphate-sugar epimerase|tara:strand:+ start:65 stop:856 length:792 start_codon:yes stop_codon:yes gene_type:complete
VTDRKKVLVTGMSGQIGGIIRRNLGDKYELSGLDRVAIDGVSSTIADISDLDAIKTVFEGIDTVVHLGADPSPRASWESILQNNIVGTRNVFEASRLAGVKRIVFASSNHAVGFYPMKQDPYKAVYEGRLEQLPRPLPRLTADLIRPDSYYGVSKTFGESLGSYFHDAYGISIICLRIGWVLTPDDPTFSPASLSLWLSHGDVAQLIEKSVDASMSVGFAVVNGESDNTLSIWDLESTKQILGYEPKDGAGDEWTSNPRGTST